MLPINALRKKIGNTNGEYTAYYTAHPAGQARYHYPATGAAASIDSGSGEPDGIGVSLFTNISLPISEEDSISISGDIHLNGGYIGD